MNILLHAISSIDMGVYHFLNRYAGNWLLDRLVSHEESNNLFKGGLFLATYVYLWFRVGPDQEERRKAIIAILTGAVLALVVNRAISDLTPFRVRPMYNPSISHHPYSFPMSLNLENWSSFPSDTATYFFALAFGLAHFLRRYTVPIMLYTVGWICLPRVFFGVHYASDIVVGARLESRWSGLHSGLSGFGPPLPPACLASWPQNQRSSILSPFSSVSSWVSSSLTFA